MAKKEQSQLILWAVVALVLGVLIGVLMTNAVATGKAKSVLSVDEAKEADLTEEGRDLILNLLKVNTIESRGDDLMINANTGLGRVNMWGSGMANISAPIVDISGPVATSISNTENSILLGSDGLNIFAHNLKVSDSNQTGYIEPVFIIDAENESIQMNADNLLINHRDGEPVLNMYAGDDGTASYIRTYSGVTEIYTDNFMLRFLSDVGTEPYQYPNLPALSTGYYTTNNPGEMEQRLDVGVPILFTLLKNGNGESGSGNAYACLDIDGKLFRSQTPCN